MKTPAKNEAELLRENAELRARLEESGGILRAIRAGEVDALVMSGQVCTLQGAETPYRILVEAMNEGAATLMEDGTVLYCNRRFGELLQISLDNIVGSLLGSHVAPGDLPAFNALLARAKNHSVEGECNLQRPDASAVPVQLSFSVLDAGGTRAICVVAADLTEHKRAEALLTRLAAIVESSDDAIFGKDLNGIITSWNRGAEKIFGYTAAELVGTSILRLIPADRREEEVQILARIVRGESVSDFETVRQTKDGRLLEVSITASPIKDAAGKIIGASKVARDITQSKEREREIRRMSRLYAALSQINQAIVWLPQRDAMLEKTCRVLVEDGGFSMAWIGQPDPETQRIKPVARWGDSAEYLSQAAIYADDRPEGRGPTGTAIREGRSYICNEFAHDLNTLPWRELANRAGFGAAAAFPIRQGGVVWGALTIYSNEIGFFQDKEIALLEEATTDISFALDNLAREESRRQADAALNRERDLWRALLDHSPDKIYFKDTQSRFVRVSKAMAIQSGVESPEAMVGRTDFDFFDESHARPANEDEQKILRTGEAVIDKEEREEWKDGHVTWVTSTKLPWLDDTGKIIGTMGISRDITARKQAEAALRAFKFATDQAADTVVWLNQNAEFLYVNDEACRSLGYAREELMRLSLFDIDPLFSRENWKTSCERFQNKQLASIRLESCHRRKDGALFPIEVVVKCLRFEGADIHVAFARDMTGHKRIEAELTRERDLWRALLDNSPDKIYFKDTQSRFVKCSRAMAVQFGVESPDALVGKMDFDFFDESHARPAYEDEQEIIRTGRPMLDREEREDWKDGHVTWVTSTKLPWLDAGGKTIGIMGVSRDITKRKQAEEAMERLATAAEQAAESIVITDTTGRILYVNPAFERTSGYTRAEVLGGNPRILKSGKQEAAYYRQMWNVLQRGEVWHGHFINRHKEGLLYEEDVTISPVRGATGKVVNYVAVKRDVTLEIKMEEQLRQSQKMEAFGQLAGGVAHDFNNILAVIQLQAGLLKADESLSPAQLEFAREIEKSAQCGADLTRQLLLFSRKQTMNPRNLKVNDLVQNIAKMLRRTLREDIELQFKLAQETLLIHADPGMMDQILLNLTVNARDAMPKGGQIIIETSAVEFDEVTAAQSPQARPGLFVCLSVTDTGCGIPPEIQPRIFEPFFTTKEAGKGTGLGLATVFGIVQQHQGWIHVYSEVNRGTTFRIYLPFHLTTADTEFIWSSPASLPGGNETILLVEDESAVRRALQGALSRLGYRVLEAATGDDALQVWKQHRDEIHLLLTDLVMPGGLNGKELAAQLLQGNPKLKVIYASGYSGEVAGKDLILEEGVNFMNKPFQSRKLAQTVRKRLDQK